MKKKFRPRIRKVEFLISKSFPFKEMVEETAHSITLDKLFHQCEEIPITLIKNKIPSYVVASKDCTVQTKTLLSPVWVK